MDQAFWLGLLQIIGINLVLSGDNAVVIALACRNLPERNKKKAVFVGSFGAIFLRIILTFVAFYLLHIPFLKIIGGLLLIWIAISLIKDDNDEDLEGKSDLWGAIKTIIFADLVMSVDNVLAIAGAAGDSWLLIIIGLVVSIPLIIWGSQLLMQLMTKFPIIVSLGAALLGYTAGEMIVTDESIGQFFHTHVILHYTIPIMLAIVVVTTGKLLQKRNTQQGTA